MLPDWTTLKLEVVFAPKTGSIKPWELWAVFSDRRTHWGSFKTEEAANKKLNRLKSFYTMEKLIENNRLIRK